MLKLDLLDICKWSCGPFCVSLLTDRHLKGKSEYYCDIDVVRVGFFCFRLCDLSMLQNLAIASSSNFLCIYSTIADVLPIQQIGDLDVTVLAHFES